MVVRDCVAFQDLAIGKLEVRSLERACNVAILRSGCGLGGWERAAWKRSWLQDGVEGAKLSPGWPKLAPRWAQKGSRNYLGSSGRCPSPLFKAHLGPILGPPWPFLGGPRGHLEASLGLEGLRLPKMGPRGLPELSWRLGSLCGAPSWAHLGPSWALLGPTLGGEGGHLEADFGFGRLDLGVQGC